MSTTADHSIRLQSKKPIDWWRWSGRVFLTFLLLFTILPMAWMLLTSVKSPRVSAFT